MEEAKNILKELRVDWSSAVEDTFNPLQLALRVSSNPTLHKEFHKLFYRLEQTMSTIITSNYQGFSDASATFGRYKDINNSIISKYDHITQKIPAMKLFQLPPIEEKILETNTDNGTMAKYDICVKIVDAKNTYKRFLADVDTGRKTASIIRALNILESQEITQIKGAFEYYKQVFRSYVEFVDEINRKLLDFIVRNEMENAQYFNTIVDLQALRRFEQFCTKNFRNAVFRMLEDIIQNTSRNTGDTMEKLHGLTPGCLIDLLCKNIAMAAETVMENTEYIIEKSKGLLSYEKTNDFFDNKKQDSHFLLDMKMCLNDIKELLCLFLERYSLEPGESAQFDINQIPDTFDYTKVFSENSQTFKRLSETSVSQAQTPLIFTLITFTSPETIPKLLCHLKNEEIKDYLYKKIGLRYLSGDAVDDKIYKVQSLITEITSDGGKITDETGEICVGNNPVVIEIGHYIDSCVAEKERSTLISWIRKCILISFLHFYNRTFTSDFVKKHEFSKLLETVDRYYGYVESEDSGYIYFSTVGNLQEFKIPNQASAYILSLDRFKANLVRQQIRKSDLFLGRKRYMRIRALTNVLSFLQERLKSPEVEFLRDLFALSSARQVLLDFFYYFDLLYREGSHFHYLKLCCECLENYSVLGIESMKDLEDSLDAYCKDNLSYIRVKNKRDLEKFIDAMVVFSNALDRNVDISEIIVFFKEIKEGKPKTSQGRSLLERIS